MSRKTTGAWNAIHSMCRLQGIKEQELYEKARMLLGIYRRVCWSVLGSADCVAEDVDYCYGSDLDRALVYLETFAPDREREHFEARIKILFETRWMLELVERAMLRVKEFPDGGDQYFEILSKSYLTRWKYTESEMLELLHLERSRFYDKKKEAVMIFGIALWGGMIPGMKNHLQKMKKEAGCAWNGPT